MGDYSPEDAAATLFSCVHRLSESANTLHYPLTRCDRNTYLRARPANSSEGRSRTRTPIRGGPPLRAGGADTPQASVRAVPPSPRGWPSVSSEEPQRTTRGLSTSLHRALSISGPKGLCSLNGRGKNTSTDRFHLSAEGWQPLDRLAGPHQSCNGIGGTPVGDYTIGEGYTIPPKRVHHRVH